MRQNTARIKNQQPQWSSAKDAHVSADDPGPSDNTRDLVIGLCSDVRHIRSQLSQILKLEERMLACEKQAADAKSYADKLLWAVCGLGAGLLTVTVVILGKVIK